MVVCDPALLDTWDAQRTSIHVFENRPPVKQGLKNHCLLNEQRCHASIRNSAAEEDMHGPNDRIYPQLNSTPSSHSSINTKTFHSVAEISNVFEEAKLCAETFHSIFVQHSWTKLKGILKLIKSLGLSFWFLVLLLLWILFSCRSI